MRTGLLLLFCCVISIVAGAQSVENTLPRPVEELPRYGFDHFTVQDGLPESFVTTLMQDPQGYLWGATQNGLFRYDGQELKTYLPHDGEHTMRNVRALITDDRGNLWVGGIFGGSLARLNRASETWTFYQHDPADASTLSLPSVFGLADAGEGRLLVVSLALDGSRICMDRLDTTTGQVRRLRLAPDGSIGPEGECIRAALSAGTSAKDVIVRQESTGETWVATSMGLLSYDPVADVFTHHRPALLNPYSDLQALEALAAKRIPLAAIQEVGGQEDRTVSFEVSEPTPVLIAGLGEMRMETRYDYGWLENAQGDTLWAMQPVPSSWGGGALRNRLVVSADTLQPGSYKLRFRSDQGHSAGEIFEGAPAHPAWWGLQVLPLEPDDVIPSATGPVSQAEDDVPAEILAVHVDASDVLWIATNNDGVYRREASSDRFVKFEPQGEDFGLQQATFLSSKTDRKGRTWFGSSAGLYRIDDFEQGVLRHIRIPAEETTQSLPLPTVTAQRNVILDIVEDQDGTLWIHTFGGLVHLDPEMEAMQIYEPDPEDPDGLGVGVMTTLFQDRQGTLWAGTRNRGLSRLNRTRSQFNAFATDLLESDAVESITEGPEGDLWVGTDEGLIRLTPSSGSVTQPASILTDQASRVYVDRSGRLWGSGTQSGLHLLDATGKVLKTYVHNPADSLSLSNNHVNVVLEDSQGRFWVGTSGAGINRFDPETGTFTRYPFHRTPRPGISDSLDNGTVFVIFEDTGGRLWTGTNLGGISLFDPEAGTFTSHFDDSRGIVAVVAIHEDAEGCLWAGSYIGGLFHFDPEANEVVAQYDESSGLLHNFVGQIQEDEAGYLWLGTGRGLVRFDPKTETFRTFHRLEGMSQRTFTATSLKTREGGLLFGGDQGLIAFDPVALAATPSPPALALEMMTHKSRDGDVQVPLGTQRFVELAHHENDVTLSFVAIDFERPDAIRYRYRLTPYDEAWIDGGTQQRARYTSLSPRWYTFEVQAVNADGLWSEPKTLRLGIHPPWWKTWWAYMLYSIPLFGFGLGILWVARRRAIQQERERSHRELEAAYTQLDASHKELQTTQAQLVQQEKMASLGQLTAGIAHEIKNPLNFVNNFADLNTELAEELREALAEGEDIEPILQDLEENATQIAKHGRRADDIVKSMMQHASTGSGEKQVIDLNAFVREYVDLAHHGKRAQGSDLDVSIKWDFDEAVGTAEIIPQEMGRVLLNLFGNAFDATMDAGTRRRGDTGKGYVPTVKVSTQRVAGGVEIRVADNGPGVPDEIRKKIFEPFFTTKPTGSGTGLGLSLSYDIVTQGHGGTLRVESEEEKGATFIVTLPSDS